MCIICIFSAAPSACWLPIAAEGSELYPEQCWKRHGSDNLKAGVSAEDQAQHSLCRLDASGVRKGCQRTSPEYPGPGL